MPTKESKLFWCSILSPRFGWCLSAQQRSRQFFHAYSVIFSQHSLSVSAVSVRLGSRHRGSNAPFWYTACPGVERATTVSHLKIRIESWQVGVGSLCSYVYVNRLCGIWCGIARFRRVVVPADFPRWCLFARRSNRAFTSRLGRLSEIMLSASRCERTFFVRTRESNEQRRSRI